MLNIVVVGPGLMGKQHIEKIEVTSGMVLSAVVAPASSVNRDYVARLSVPMFSDLGRCIESKKPDGVIIASPNKFHTEQAIKCIKHDIPVLIEKPLATCLKEGKRIVDFAQERDFVHKVMVGHHRAYSPLIQQACRIIKSGRLGNLVTMQGSAQFYKPEHYFVEGEWRTRLGGGPILINMIHEIGNLRKLIGEIEAVQVISSSERRGYEVEDTAVINFRFENGVLGSFVLSDTAASTQSWELTSAENPYYPHYAEENCYSISGTLGTLDIPTMNVKTYASSDTASWMKAFDEYDDPVDRQDPLLLQLEHFKQVLNGAEDPVVSVWDGYSNLAVVEAIKQAEKSGCLERVVY
jgi:predicted dehydrogenase